MSDQDPSPPFDEAPTRPPFDPELEPVVDAMAGLLPRFSAETLPALRQFSLEAVPGADPLDLTAGGSVRVEEREVPGPADAPDVPVLILTPRGGPQVKAAIFHIHGGGMVSGDRRMGIESFLPFAADGSAVIVSVEYRLAPEHPDPAPVEDCYAGLVWMAKNAADLGIDPDRIMIAGTSAGGGLAAGTALLARDRGFPRLSHQVLLTPMLDDRFQTHSSRMLDGEGVWDRNDNLFGWTSLLGERRGCAEVSPYAAPARATELRGLPRTYIDTGTVDSFRDEILTYAGRLCEAGVNVDLHMWGGGFHGFDLVAGHAELSQASKNTRDAFIRRAIG